MINIIAAVGKNLELGKDNKLIWHLSNDLKYFKETTLNHPVIMGKNTYLSIGRPLPNRENIVISKTLKDDKVTVVSSVKEALELIKDKDAFVIGGASIYNEFLKYADNLYLTEINDTKKADTFFPKFDKDKYTKKIISKEKEGNIEYDFTIYSKKRGKLIVIEGTDCSGKETQSNLLIDYLNKKGQKTVRLSYPNYDSPTGKIIGGSYLGKPHIGPCIFPEGAVNVNPYVACLYYAADRYYNKDIIDMHLNEGTNVILDRYVFSNMAHQASKLNTKEEREKMYQFIEDLEFNLLKLHKVDGAFLLYMPVEAAKVLREKREEKLDEHEKNTEYLERSASCYLEIAKKYGFKVINCTDEQDNILSIEEINQKVIEVYEKEL